MYHIHTLRVHWLILLVSNMKDIVMFTLNQNNEIIYNYV